MCFGTGVVSMMVFSPEVNRTGSIMASFFLASVMHGLVTIASTRGGYCPRMLAGSYFGQAVRTSAWVVFLEWCMIIALGRYFQTTTNPTVPLWRVISVLLFAAVATAMPQTAMPQTQGGDYRVTTGRPPVVCWRFSEMKWTMDIEGRIVRPESLRSSRNDLKESIYKLNLDVSR